MLKPREREVLLTIVEYFLQTGNPISSQKVSTLSSLNLSSASIRNVMAQLDHKGYLEQPHTSAGRLPTSKAIRFYIDQIYKSLSFSSIEKHQLMISLKKNMPDVETTLSTASKILSSVSRQISLVLTPQKKFTHWKQISFLWLKSGVILSILVLEEGLVQNKVISVSKDISKDDLIKFSNMLNDKFQGLPLYLVRTKILEELKNAKLKLEQIYQRAFQIVQETFEHNSCKFFMEGTNNLWEREQIRDIQALKELFKFLEEKSSLLEILDKTIDSDGLNVLIGQEDLECLQDYSLICSPYSINNEVYGFVSVIGPTRMNYPKIIPRVDLISRVLTEIFQEFY
ncbi:MAG: heat-inducible transcriptional repressor HrcA [Desulfonauticus sp.]|nr:heat-inducible transcriptional repressor HrcA [Desulfonauticus sp.]